MGRDWVAAALPMTWANLLLLLVPLAGLVGTTLTLLLARRAGGAVLRGLTWTMLAMLGLRQTFPLCGTKSHLSECTTIGLYRSDN